MAQWEAQALTWDGQPINGTDSEGYEFAFVELVEANTRDDAVEAGFSAFSAFVPGLPDGSLVKVRPIGGVVDDTNPCGCRHSGLTRAHKGVTYDTVRTPRVDANGIHFCTGCRPV